MAGPLWVIRPIGDSWTDPRTENRRSAGVFQVKWDAVLAELRDEVSKVGGTYPLVFQMDCDESDLRLDGMLRSHARTGPFPGVIVSFGSEFGPLRLATDVYEQRWGGGLTGWQANVRAITLTLKALRDLDRWGVSKRGQQYTGWQAIDPPRNGHFATPADAEKWMRDYAALTLDIRDAPTLDADVLYRRMARLMHPDKGHPRADWDRLDEANRLVGAR